MELTSEHLLGKYTPEKAVITAKQKLILIAIVVGFLLLQSVKFGHRWVDDESWYTMPIPSILNDGKFRIPTIPGGDVFWPVPPLLTYSQAAIDSFVPLTPIIGRLVPLTAGAFSILAVFLLTRRLYGNNVALLAAFFMAADNLIFLAARIIRPEALVTVFFLFALYFTVKSLNKNLGFKELTLAGLFSALAFCSHPNGLLAPLCIGCILLFSYGFRMDFLKKSLISGTAFIVFMLPFVFWVIYYDGPNEFINFKHTWLESYGRHSETNSGTFSTLINLVSAEVNGRYKDFIRYPFRVHIAIVSLGLIIFSLLSKNRTNRLIAGLAVLQLLFFVFVNNSNPSVRYMAVFTPLIAILAAYWCWHLYQASSLKLDNMLQFSWLTDRKAIIAALIFLSIGVSQVAGNVVYLWKFRHADYDKVITELKTIIPEKSTVYGGMAFWLGLREHQYVPYMRKPWQQALQQYNPNIIIIDDWVMTEGGSKGEWYPLKVELQSYISQHGKLLGEVSNDFYGDMKVYQLHE